MGDEKRARYNAQSVASGARNRLKDEDESEKV